jgi:hypothetical protein
MNSHADIMVVCVLHSTFPFMTSYARSLLGLYDDDGTKNEWLESICVPDRDRFLYNCARHFWRVSFWIFQHICTLAARSTASYWILDLHESNLWMRLDLHIRVIAAWRACDAMSDSDGVGHGDETMEIPRLILCANAPAALSNLQQTHGARQAHRPMSYCTRVHMECRIDVDR